jgi:DnaK suppressor protein
MDSNTLKQLLLDEIRKTEDLIVSYTEQTQPISPDNAIGRVSRMDAIINKSMMESSLYEAHKKLDGLKRVLAKAGTANFGCCRTCGQAIPAERILIIPESEYCVRCSR